MKKAMDIFWEMAGNLNPVSRWTVRIGSVLIALVYLGALIAVIGAGRWMDYDAAMFLRDDFLYCGKECIGAVYIPALLVEMVDIATGKQRSEAKK